MWCWKNISFLPVSLHQQTAGNVPSLAGYAATNTANRKPQEQLIMASIADCSLTFLIFSKCWKERLKTLQKHSQFCWCPDRTPGFGSCSFSRFMVKAARVSIRLLTAWPIWLPSMTKCLNLWMQGQHLDFCKAFNTLFHSILISKVRYHSLDEWITRQIKNWLDGQA